MLVAAIGVGCTSSPALAGATTNVGRSYYVNSRSIATHGVPAAVVDGCSSRHAGCIMSWAPSQLVGSSFAARRRNVPLAFAAGLMRSPPSRSQLRPVATPDIRRNVCCARERRNGRERRERNEWLAAFTKR